MDAEKIKVVTKSGPVGPAEVNGRKFYHVSRWTARKHINDLEDAKTWSSESGESTGNDTPPLRNSSYVSELSVEPGKELPTAMERHGPKIPIEEETLDEKVHEHEPGDEKTAAIGKEACVPHLEAHRSMV